MTYVHALANQGASKEQPYKILTPKAVAYYESLKEKGVNVYIDTLTYKGFGVLTELDMKKRFLSLDEKEQRERLNREQENELQYAPKPVQSQSADVEKKTEPKVGET